MKSTNKGVYKLEGKNESSDRRRIRRKTVGRKTREGGEAWAVLYLWAVLSSCRQTDGTRDRVVGR
jgi:hypothetical protein